MKTCIAICLGLSSSYLIKSPGKILSTLIKILEWMY